MRINKTVTAGLLLGLALGAGTAFADDDNQLSGLTAQWWQVMLSIPTTVNPLLDTTGADCMVGQRGPVWFLAGTFSTVATIRACSVPEGEWLFFPVVNYVNVNTPTCGTGNQSVADLRAQSAPFIDTATGLSVHLDGQQIKNVVRVKSVPFAVTLPSDNIFGASCLPAGSYSPTVDDGYYTLLPPLSLGKHTLHIQGQIPMSSGFTVDVTYNLTIVPVLLK
jgi:hypothetical protein